MSGPVHCTDTLLVSVVSRAEQGRDIQTVTGRERERGRDFALAERAKRVVHLGVGVCICVCLGDYSSWRVFVCVFLGVQYVMVCVALKLRWPELKNKVREMETPSSVLVINEN